MAQTTLETLLRRIRDGLASADELAEARALASADERLPEVLRQGVLEDEPAAEAAGLLALLDPTDTLGLADAVAAEVGIDFDDLALDDEWEPIAAALREGIVAEAGTIDLGATVLTAIGRNVHPVGSAVLDEAGSVDVVEPVMEATEGGWLSAMLDNELSGADKSRAVAQLASDANARLAMTALADLGRDLRYAVRKEAGEAPYVWPGVASAIGIDDPEAVQGFDGRVFAEAVRAESGSIHTDVADAVMARIRRQSAPPVMPVVPEPANDPAPSRWTTRVLIALAAVLFFSVLGRAVLNQGLFEGGQADQPEQIAALNTLPDDDALTFASADEVTVHELEYGEDVQVFQAEGDEGAVILWLDEEAML